MKLEKIEIIIDENVLFLFKEAPRKRKLECTEKEKKQKDQVVFCSFFFFPCQAVGE